MKKVICILMLILLVIPALFTYAELGTLNPIGAAVGLVRVCVFDEPYVRTGYFTRAYLSQPEGGFDLFLSKMEEWGYTHLPEEQMGSVYIFEDAEGEQTKVRFLVNRYFAKWIWY